MAYYFTTPTVSEGPLADGPLFSRYRLTKGVSVIKEDGVYRELRDPSTEEIQAAQAFYLGGITHKLLSQSLRRLRLRCQVWDQQPRLLLRQHLSQSLQCQPLRNIEVLLHTGQIIQ
jgi:hypothetical protein